jgi:hypothetical protein
MQMDVDTDAADRRRARSSDPQEALSLQLSYVRSEAGLDALVLASHDGLTIAHAGDLDLCSELAALAPILSNGMSSGDLSNGISSGDAGASATDIQQGLLFVREVYFEGTALYLASCGDNVSDNAPAEVDRWLIEATVGVTRILSDAA